MFTLGLLLACQGSDTPRTPAPPDTQPADTQDSGPAPSTGNVLILIADDMGLDSSPCYGLSSDPVRMPNLEKICSQGVRFDRAWMTPICSPTRATLLSGTDPAIHGVLQAHTQGRPGLPAQTLTLPALATQAGIATASFGKWHLGDEPQVGAEVPNHFGWQHYSGLLGGGVRSYWDWERTENGLTSISTDYTTTSLVDDASDWVADQPGPWLMWVAFNAPRPPYHVPPEGLHSDAALGPAGDCPEGEDRACYVASLEALDTEMGRLLDQLQASGQLENTLVIFLGDNGTETDVVVPPVVRAKGKGSLFEGGIRIPMVAMGPGVQRGEVTQALSDGTDLLPTVLDFWGLPTAELSGQSLLPVLQDPSLPGKESVFTGYLKDPAEPTNGWTVAQADYKLMQMENGSELLFKVSTDPWETANLWPSEDPALIAIHAALEAELTRRKAAGGF